MNGMEWNGMEWNRMNAFIGAKQFHPIFTIIHMYVLEQVLYNFIT
jgi:hypothetical protein